MRTIAVAIETVHKRIPVITVYRFESDNETRELEHELLTICNNMKMTCEWLKCKYKCSKDNMSTFTSRKEMDFNESDNTYILIVGRWYKHVETNGNVKYLTRLSDAYKGDLSKKKIYV